jgi:hypothetical protein
MTLYLGYYRPSAAQWQRFAEAEDNGTVEEAQQTFMARVLAARESNFAGNIVASYSPMSTSFDHPSIMVVETDDTSTLAAINAHYNSVLEFTWTPGNSIGTTTDSAEAGMQKQFGRN